MDLIDGYRKKKCKLTSVTNDIIKLMKVAVFISMLITLILNPKLSKAQISFEDITISSPDFVGVYNSAVAFADIDGDNDQDVLIMGTDNSFVSPILYINDGQGGYTMVEDVPFKKGGASAAIAFTDIDGDGDQDLLITESHFNPIAELYTNDGNGVFALVNNTPFEGVGLSSIAFADVDGDNDQDVLISGNNSNSILITELYLNDGEGFFTFQIDVKFERVYDGDMAFADIDGDGDQDVLITGKDFDEKPTTILYQNDGSGDFTVIDETPFVGVYWGEIAFSDIDGDSDQDVIITGVSFEGNVLTMLYTNDGNGSFTLIDDTSLENVYSSSIAFSDVDGDNDQDLIITGINSDNDFVTQLYSNSGSGVFTPVNDLILETASQGSVRFSDVDGDNDQDLLITGFNNDYIPSIKLYRNTSSPNVNVNENSSPLKTTIFPNPTRGVLQIDLNSISNSVVIKISDSTGQIIDVVNEGVTTTNTVDLSKYDQGIYFLSIETNGVQVDAKRILKM